MEETKCTNKAGDFFLAKGSRVGGPVTCVSFSPSKSSTENHNQPRSSFFFVAQGPYLTRYNDEIHGLNTVGDENRENQDQQLLVFPEDERRPRGGGTVHGISFVERDESDSVPWDSVVYGGKRLAFCHLLGKDVGRCDVVQTFGEESSAEIMGKRDTDRNCILSNSPFLELDDWIWNVKLLAEGSQSNIDGNSKSGTNKSKTRMVVGFARHMIEVWDLDDATTATDGAIRSTRLRRLFFKPPTVVTSMDFIFVNQNHHSNNDCNNGNDETICDTLWVAAGTSFHKIWISCIPLKDIISQKAEYQNDFLDSVVEKVDMTYFQPAMHHLLQGHSGVVHSVKWFEDGGKISLASTSDDRSVRKWIWHDARKEWIERWVGWGHSARVWNVSMVNSSMLVSVAEDGTARIWSSESGDTLACIHHSKSLWTIDTRNTADGGEFIIGGTDGISGTYRVCNHISTGNNLRVDSIAVPDDRPPRSSEVSTAVVKSASLSVKSNEQEMIVNTKKKKKTKKKIQSQVIVGMKCWENKSAGTAPRVVVATREGSLMSFNINEQNWNNHDPWWESTIGERFGIEANDGNCMALRDNMFAVAIGTARGDIILASIEEGKGKNHSVLKARELRAVQGLAFLDSSCLVSFHVRAVALWQMEFDASPTPSEVHPTHVLEIETKGIPQCCAYDRENQRIIVGDSRGNLSYFLIMNQDDTNADGENRIKSVCALTRVHQKQHVTSIKWLNGNTILSAGNDGCLHVSYLHGNLLQRGWSFSASCLTGITSIITTNSSTGAESYSGPIIVTGYHGNTYRVMDVESGYEYIRCDTGGRQRILDCRFNTNRTTVVATPLTYQLVVCQAQKDGSNRIFIQHLSMPNVPKTIRGHDHVARGVKLHGETIFDSSFFTLTNQELVFLVTASEDCTTRISAWKDGRIIDSVQLTPQESCCRCISVSKIDDRSVLLVVGGGKLVLQFFLIKAGTNGSSKYSARNLEIVFLGNGLTSKRGATIDHRINAISALPLCDGNDRFHLVLAGDSEGSSHAFLISEDCTKSYRDLRGIIVPTTSERPILCIQMLAVYGRALILMGTTSGDIELFDLPVSLPNLRDHWDRFEGLWNYIGQYQGHQMGTNAITAQVLPSQTVNNKIKTTISIVSGGDDQALCISRVYLEKKEGVNDSLRLAREPLSKVIPEASFSAIKGVSHVDFRHQKYLLSVGYSQQLSIWKFNPDEDMILECTSRLPVDLGDVNCLSVYISSDESTCLVAVCGMGVEVFRDKISKQIE